MSKLPVLSGAECIKALGKIGFEVYRQRGSHIVVVRKSPPAQTTITKSWIEARSARIIRQAGLTIEEFIALI